MKGFFKRIYLLYFQFKYFLFGIFINQDDNAILFIQDFKGTLDYIQKRHANSLYNKLNIYKKERTNSKIKKMLRAKYIYVDNYNVLLGYINSKNKCIVQVWHAGIAIKKIGFDDASTSEGRFDKTRYKRVYDSVDYYVCGSLHMKNIFMQSFLQPEEKMLDYGYPGFDYYLDSTFNKKVEKIKVENEYLLDRLNILYVPTFREREEDNLKQISFINKLFEDFEENYNILYKMHNNVNVPKNIEINGKEVLDDELCEIVEISDIVITDYSSIALEAIIQGKPIIYYLYDLEEYVENRGLNVNILKLPGVATKKYSEVKRIIEEKDYEASGVDSLDPQFVPYNLKDGRNMITAKVIKKVLSL